MNCPPEENLIAVSLAIVVRWLIVSRTMCLLCSCKAHPLTYLDMEYNALLKERPLFSPEKERAVFEGSLTVVFKMNSVRSRLKFSYFTLLTREIKRIELSAGTRKRARNPRLFYYTDCASARVLLHHGTDGPMTRKKSWLLQRMHRYKSFDNKLLAIELLNSVFIYISTSNQQSSLATTIKCS